MCQDRTEKRQMTGRRRVTKIMDWMDQGTTRSVYMTAQNIQMLLLPGSLHYALSPSVCIPFLPQNARAKTKTGQAEHTRQQKKPQEQQTRNPTQNSNVVMMPVFSNPSPAPARRNEFTDN